jgi:hypothetical protein
MSLEGNLTAFGLSEILQLIAVQQKSGMLTVTRDDHAKVLFFREGNIISTRDRRRHTKDPLRDYLTRYGILSREDLIRLTHISTESRLDLTEIIVSEGVLTDEQMMKHFRDHIQEETHEVLTWEQCSYKFIPGNDIIDGIKVWGEFNIEGMLMESMRRIDEFPQSLKLLPDLGARIHRVRDPKEDEELTRNETAVLELLDSEQTLSYLIGRARIPQYETYEAVRYLHEKDIVEVTAQEASGEAGRDARTRTKRRRKRPRKNLLPFAVSFVLFTTGLGWGVVRTMPHLEGVLTGGRVRSIESVSGRNRTQATLRWTLEAYYARNGHYPSALTALVESGLANESFLHTVSGYSIRYHLTDDGRRYTLL